MKEYTPGPWTFEVTDTWSIVAGNQTIMCDEPYYPWNSTNEADWHLIAAAPEMLESLKEMVATLDDGAAIFENAKRIIRKAEGV